MRRSSEHVVVRWWRASALRGGGGCVGGSEGALAPRTRRSSKAVHARRGAGRHAAQDSTSTSRTRFTSSATSSSPRRAKPGQDVKLTFYWRCDDTLDDGWPLFTHIERRGAATRCDNLDYVGPAPRSARATQQVLGPDKWEKGKVYVDEQTYKMPD